MIQEIDLIEDDLTAENPLEYPARDLERSLQELPTPDDRITEIPPIQELPPLDQTIPQPEPTDLSFLKQRQPKPPKMKRRIRIRQKKHPLGTEELQEPVKPIKATFTLQLDNEGNLIGLPLKKPRPKKEKSEKKRISIPFKRKKERPKPEETTEKAKIGFASKLGKITGIFSRLKPKRSGGESTDNPLTNAIGKIKRIFSRS